MVHPETLDYLLGQIHCAVFEFEEPMDPPPKKQCPLSEYIVMYSIVSRTEITFIVLLPNNKIIITQVEAPAYNALLKYS